MWSTQKPSQSPPWMKCWMLDGHGNRGQNRLPWTRLDYSTTVDRPMHFVHAHTNACSDKSHASHTTANQILRFGFNECTSFKIKLERCWLLTEWWMTVVETWVGGHDLTQVLCVLTFARLSNIRNAFIILCRRRFWKYHLIILRAMILIECILSVWLTKRENTTHRHKEPEGHVRVSD